MSGNEGRFGAVTRNGRYLIYTRSAGDGSVSRYEIPVPVLEGVEASPEANLRAYQLLQSHLNPIQLNSLLTRGYFLAKGSYTGCMWRVNVGVVSRSHNVSYDGSKFTVCAWYGAASAPFCDQVLAQKMLIETDEIEFLAIALTHGQVPPELTRVFLGPVRQRKREHRGLPPHRPWWIRLWRWLNHDVDPLHG